MGGIIFNQVKTYVNRYVVIQSVNSKLCVSGRELTQGHQLGLAGGVSFPVFWLAGAGAAVFWILGVHYFSSLPHCVDKFSTNALFIYSETIKFVCI